MSFLKREIKELRKLDEIVDDLGSWAQHEVIDEVEHEGEKYPLRVVSLGSTNMSDPCLAFFGGVHGLESIGCDVVLAYMRTVAELLKWDKDFQDRLRRSRLLFFPVVNPVGVATLQRSNGNGVDLMRNAPTAGAAPLKSLYQGHRISNKLPYYRGPVEGQMEIESAAMCRIVRERLFPSQLSIAVDVHSGFGSVDRFWFPYASHREPVVTLPEILALKNLFDRSYPKHFYQIEPVCRQYTIYGDLWDYLLDEYRSAKDPVRFFPWTLEMGSWLWLRKNPFQITSKFGWFHPTKPHRRQRILRRHITLFDFLHRSVLSPEPWIGLRNEDRDLFFAKALELWYGPNK